MIIVTLFLTLSLKSVSHHPSSDKHLYEQRKTPKMGRESIVLCNFANVNFLDKSSHKEESQ